MKGSATAGTATWAVRRPSLLKRPLVWADRRIKARENWQGSDPDWLRPVIVMGPIISLGVLIVSWPAGRPGRADVLLRSPVLALPLLADSP